MNVEDTCEWNKTIERDVAYDIFHVKSKKAKLIKEGVEWCLPGTGREGESDPVYKCEI